jgi:L-fuconolactonase
MTTLRTPVEMIDTHQHLWMMSERAYDWISPDYGPLYDDFGPERVAADIEEAGVTGTVLVQAADTYEDTFYMLSVADRVPSVLGVVAWAPLDRFEEARAALDLYALSPLVNGVRCLTHNYEDPRWILGESVDRSVSLLAPRSLALDMVSVLDEHLRTVAEVAERHPDLTVVLDHMAKPPIATEGWEPWATLIAEVAQRPNTVVKLSGLNTASKPEWTAADWTRYVDHVVENFGSSRMMMGSDWPVSILAGDFVGVWRAQREVIAKLSGDEQDDILFRTARRVYGL